MNPETVNLKASGKNIEQAFEKSAQLMFQEILDTENIDFVGQYNISLSADSPEHLLENWLNILLILHNKYDLVFQFFKVTIDQENNTLNATICGDKYSAEKHEIHKNLSQVTGTPHLTMKKRSATIEFILK